MKRLVTAPVLLLTLTFFASAPVDVFAQSTPATSSAYSVSSFEQELLTLTNTDRASSGDSRCRAGKSKRHDDKSIFFPCLPHGSSTVVLVYTKRIYLYIRGREFSNGFLHSCQLGSGMDGVAHTPRKYP